MDILNVVGINIGSLQEIFCVGNDMSLASMEALVGVKSAWPAGLRRRCGPTIDNGSCQFGLSSQFLGAPSEPEASRSPAIYPYRAKRKNCLAPSRLFSSKPLDDPDNGPQLLDCSISNGDTCPVVSGVGLVFAIFVLFLLLLLSFGAGYLTRDIISRRRRAEARRWAPYTQPNWLPAHPANHNKKAHTLQGELGQMLNHWDQRARARRRP